MSDFITSEAVPGQLALSGEMTIFAAAQIKDDWLNRLNANEALSIDLSGVTEIDSSGVQLMLMLQRAAQMQHKPLRWTDHSPSVVRVLDLLKLGSVFDAPAAVDWS